MSKAAPNEDRSSTRTEDDGGACQEPMSNMMVSLSLQQRHKRKRKGNDWSHQNCVGETSAMHADHNISILEDFCHFTRTQGLKITAGLKRACNFDERE